MLSFTAPERPTRTVFMVSPDFLNSSLLLTLLTDAFPAIRLARMKYLDFERIVYHTAHKPFLHEKFPRCRFFQRCALQLHIHKSEVGILAAVHIIAEIKFLDKLSEPSLSGIFFRLRRKIAQTFINQMLAIIEYRDYILFVIWERRHCQLAD